MDAATMEGYLDRLFSDCGHVELRHQIRVGDKDRWSTHWFSDTGSLMRKARSLGGVGNLFTSLHRPAGLLNAPLSGDQVVRFTRLLFDLDPARPKKSSSTAGELAHAEEMAGELLKTLRACGWPEPLQAMSGNGRHLQYRVALPNDDETAEMLRLVYRGMKGEFSNENVDFDPTVRNAARICALYGSVKRKGVRTPERPHRRSQVWIPSRWRQVTRGQVESVANYYANQQKAAEVYRPEFRPRISGKGDFNTLDIVAWFTAHGLYHKASGDPGKHFVRCPWEADHSDGFDAQLKDTIIFESSASWPGFHCSHQHCEGRGIELVMQALGGADTYCARSWEKQV